MDPSSHISALVFPRVESNIKSLDAPAKVDSSLRRASRGFKMDAEGEGAVGMKWQLDGEQGVAAGTPSRGECDGEGRRENSRLQQLAHSSASVQFRARREFQCGLHAGPYSSSCKLPVRANHICFLLLRFSLPPCLSLALHLSPLWPSAAWLWPRPGPALSLIDRGNHFLARADSSRWPSFRDAQTDRALSGPSPARCKRCNSSERRKRASIKTDISREPPCNLRTRVPSFVRDKIIKRLRQRRGPSEYFTKDERPCAHTPAANRPPASLSSNSLLALRQYSTVGKEKIRSILLETDRLDSHFDVEDSMEIKRSE
ncbi:hypothetical protein KM043_000720 [Ampulex compressa]|nr:hypothetical protein KM043_000720 [Ampulex compressa]